MPCLSDTAEHALGSVPEGEWSQDHVVRTDQHRLRDYQPERHSGLEVMQLSGVVVWSGGNWRYERTLSSEKKEATLGHE
jgi:hypothetical protein